MHPKLLSMDAMFKENILLIAPLSRWHRIQNRQVQCMKDQMQVSHVDKDMVEQSNTVP